MKCVLVLDLLLRTVRLVLEVRHEQRQGFTMLRAELESRLAPRDQQAHAAPAPLPDLPALPATSLEELEAAEAALENEDVASAIVKTTFFCFYTASVLQQYSFFLNFKFVLMSSKGDKL